MIPQAQIDRLLKFSTPTISNAIELLKLRRCDLGYTRHPIRCMVSPGRVVAGHACTALIRTSAGPDDPRRVDPFAWWELIQSVPAPRVVVMHDQDFPENRGSFWGEVQGNIHRALGCTGIVTDGFVRDVAEMDRLGLLVLATGVTVSRCYPRLLEIGKPVSVLGETIHTGDLVHADSHGLTMVPVEAVDQILETAATIEEQEQAIIGACQQDSFSVSELRRVYSAYRR